MDASPKVAVAPKRQVRTVVLTLGAGDRLGAQLEDIRIAKAAGRHASPSAMATGSEK